MKGGVSLIQSRQMDARTRYFQLLCEMAKLFRNFHHKNDLLELIEERIGPTNFVRDPNVEGITIIEGVDGLADIANSAINIINLLGKESYSKLIERFEKQILNMNTIIPDNLIPAGDLFSKSGGNWYESTLCFYSVLLSVKGEEQKAQQIWLKCIKKGYHYGGLLLFSVSQLINNKEKIDQAFERFSHLDLNEKTFDSFFKYLCGYSYLIVNEKYAEFIRFASDRKMKNAFVLSEELLTMFNQRKNDIVNFSYCEHIISRFRTCYFIINHDIKKARNEYERPLKFEKNINSSNLDKLFDRIVNDPEYEITKYFGK